MDSLIENAHRIYPFWVHVWVWIVKALASMTRWVSQEVIKKTNNSFSLKNRFSFLSLTSPNLVREVLQTCCLIIIVFTLLDVYDASSSCSCVNVSNFKVFQPRSHPSQAAHSHLCWVICAAVESILMDISVHQWTLGAGDRQYCSLNSGELRCHPLETGPCLQWHPPYANFDAGWIALEFVDYSSLLPKYTTSDTTTI